MDQPTSPYAAPASAVADRAEQPGRPLLALLVSVAVDVIGTIIVSMLIAFGYGIVLAINGADEAEMERLMTTAGGPLFAVLGGIFGCAVSVIAGYWCARIGKQRIYLLGTIHTVLTSAFFMLLTPPQYSLLELLLALLSLAAVLLGCYLWQRNNRLTPAAAPASPTQ